MQHHRRRKRPSFKVQEYELDDLFAAFRIFERLADGSLTETLEEDQPAPSIRCSLGGESFHTRVWDQSGSMIARIHYVRCAFGHITGVWPSVLFYPDLTLYRRGHQRRPPPDA